MSSRRPRPIAALLVRWGFLVVAGLIAAPQPVSAKIIKTRRTASSLWSPLAPLTIGSGFEFESDSEQSESGFPILLEYSFTERLQVTVEPNFVYIKGKAEDVRTVGGFGDLETALEYEFVRERRYRPALTAEALVKWPTASDPDLGNPGTDYSLGLIASKDLVFVDLDFNALYTVVGDPDLENTFETSLAAEWHLNRRLDLIAEIVHAIGGGIRGTPGSISGVGAPDSSGNETEGTLGLAWHANRFLKLEVGGVVRRDNSWQLVFAWEYSFGGD